MRIEVIEAETKFVDQVVSKGVGLAGSEALGGVGAVAVLKAAAVEHVVERRGQEIAVFAITVAGKKIVLLADGVVAANVELVLRFAALWIGKESLGAELRRIGRGKQISQLAAQRIDAAIGAVEYIRRQSAGGVASDRVAAKPVGI